MNSRGTENDILIKNVKEQMDRLVNQLQDLEENKFLLDEVDYNDCKQDTMQQLTEFSESLERLPSTNMSFDSISELRTVKQAAQLALMTINFKPSAVKKMFKEREPDLLKEHLALLDRDEKLGKIGKKNADDQRAEIMNSLRQLGKKLEASDLQFLERLSLHDIDTTRYVQIAEPTEKGKMALDIVAEEVKATQDA